jgi:hypothetical protein
MIGVSAGRPAAAGINSLARCSGGGHRSLEAALTMIARRLGSLV